MDDTYFLDFPIFFNENTIYLTDNDSCGKKDNRIDISGFNSTILESLPLSKNKEIYLFHPDKARLHQTFLDNFKVIEAAGGKVRNPQNHILFIYRLDKWDLPKGKIDKGETIEAAAVREVEEETGITGVEIVSPLRTTYHIYKHKGEYVLKVTHWFNMKSDYNGSLTPEQEEHITKVAWLSDRELNSALENTYGNIKLLFS